jgi:hypothetical protein
MGEGGVHSLAKRKESRTMAVDRKIQYVEWGQEQTCVQAAGCGHRLLPLVSLALSVLTPVPAPTGPVKLLPWLTHSYILFHFFCKWLTHHPDDGGSNTSETLANFYQTTQHNIPEDSHHHTAVRTWNLTQDIMFHNEASWLYTWDVLLGARTLNLPQSVLEKASGFWPFPFTALLVWTLLGGSKFFLALLAGLVTVGDAASDFFRRLSPAAAGWSSVSSRARRRLK